MILRVHLGWLRIGLLILLATCSGCGQQQFLAETVVHPDGKVSRLICQEWTATPEAAQTDARWEWAGRSTQPLNFHDPDSFDPESFKHQVQGKYFIAAKVFPSAKEIPEHVEFHPITVREGERHPNSPISRLQREYKTTDYLFVVEHQWTETLTDHVSLLEMRAGRKKLAQLVLETFRDAFPRVFPQFDAALLLKWLETEGVELCDEVIDIHYEERLSPGPTLQKRLRTRTETVFKKFGVESLIADSPEGEEPQLPEKLLKMIRQKAEPGHATAPEAKRIFHLLGLCIGLDGFLAGQDNSDIADDFKKVLQERYGDDGEQVYQRKLATHWVTILGVHGLFHDHLKFDYKLTLPGVIVATSGTIESTNSVRFQFSAADAYPRGYTMSAKSWFADEKTQQRFLHRNPLQTREQLGKYMELIRDDDGLRKILNDCRERKAIGPLVEELAERMQSENETTRNRATSLRKLLGL